MKQRDLPVVRPRVLVAAISQALVMQTASAAVITVDSLSDSPTRFHCTLRNAISSANNDATNTTCTVGNGSDTIVFDPAILPGTIVLGGSALSISSELTIDGPGPDQLAVSAARASRVFMVDDGIAFDIPTVLVSGLRITGGIAINGEIFTPGGGVFNRERLTMRDCTLSGNIGSVGGAIYNGFASLTIDNCLISNNTAGFAGGGVFNRGGAYIERSQFRDNEAVDGGAIANVGGANAVVSTSTLSQNTASHSGGAIHNEDPSLLTVDRSTIDTNLALNEGGGLYSSGRLELTNSTLYQNSAEVRGGSVYATNSVSLLHATLVGGSAPNIGGLLVDNANTLSFLNSIVADSSGADCSIDSTNTRSTGAFIQDGSCNFFYSSQGDPKLTALRDNGGATLTLGPAADSPLINLANPSRCLAQDQRGIDRDDGDCDTGAVEVQPWRLQVTTTADSEADNGDCSLREAVNAANTNSASGSVDRECQAGLGSALIEFAPELAPSTVTLQGNPLVTTASMEIRGDTVSGITIRGEATPAFVNGDAAELAYGDPNHQLTLTRLTIEDAATINYANLLLDGSTLTGYEGTPLTNSHVATVRNSTISGNQGQNAILNQNFVYDPGQPARLIIANSTIADNSVSAAIALRYYSYLELDSALIAGNVGRYDPGSGEVLPVVQCSNSSYFTDSAVTLTATSLIEDGTCLGAGDPLALTGPAGLGPLASNIGPTPVHAIQPGSQLIDAGELSCDSPDQTGMPRPIDGNADGAASCDPGAVEFVDLFPPAIWLIDAPAVAEPGGSQITIRIGLRDDAPIDLTQIDGADLTIAGDPAIEATPNATATEIDYTFGAPGGQWAYTDNGSYPIAVAANQIFDTAVTGANSAPAAVLGSFDVAIREIELSGNGLEISSGDGLPETADGTDWGDQVLGQSAERSFTIRNIGAGTLNIAGAITATGSGFTVIQPDQLSLGADQATEFQLTFTPDQAGNFGAVIVVPNDDPDEPAYSFAVSGQGVVPNEEIFSDGFELP